MTEKPLSNNSVEINSVCPVYKSEKVLPFSRNIISRATILTTMSIAKGSVCKHQFQAFIDKNFRVRGYHQVLDIKQSSENRYSQGKIQNLAEIYKEFGEFIDDSNESFQDFIKNNTEIKKIGKNQNSNNQKIH